MRGAIHALTAALAATAVATMAAACGDDIRAFSDGSSPDAPPQGIPGYDDKAEIIRGPYLQLPTGTSMTVIWFSDLPATSRVEYGTTSDHGQVATGRTRRFDFGFDGPPPTGWMHEVTLTDLEPATTYFYRVASIAEPTEGLSFHTAPLPGESFRVAIYGDTRFDQTVHAQVVDAILAQTPDLLLFTGDFNNNSGNDNDWNIWFRVEAPLIARVPILPAIGNHELFQYKGGAHYDLSFVGPPTAMTDFYGERSARLYSYDYGSLHVLALDPYGDRGDMVDFMEADLASPAATEAKFRIVMMHEPLYTFSYHRPDGTLRDAVLPRARAGGVQVLAAGHNHLYERFWLGDIQQLVSGGAGGAYHELNSSSGPTGRLADDPALRVAAAKEHNYIIADFAGDIATFRVYKPDDGTQLDCFLVDATQVPPQNLPCL